MNEIRNKSKEIYLFLLITVMLSILLNAISSYLFEEVPLFAFILALILAAGIIVFIIWYILSGIEQKKVEFPVAFLFDCKNRQPTWFMQLMPHCSNEWLMHIFNAWDTATKKEGFELYETGDICRPRFDLIINIVEYALLSILTHTYSFGWKRTRTLNLPHSSSSAFANCESVLIDKGEIASKFGEKNPLLLPDVSEAHIGFHLPPSASIQRLEEGLGSMGGFKIKTRYASVVVDILSAESGRFGKNENQIWMSYALVSATYSVKAWYWFSPFIKTKHTYIKWAEDMICKLESDARFKPISEIEEILKGNSLFTQQ